MGHWECWKSCRIPLDFKMISLLDEKKKKCMAQKENMNVCFAADQVDGQRLHGCSEQQATELLHQTGQTVCLRMLRRASTAQPPPPLPAIPKPPRSAKANQNRKLSFNTDQGSPCPSQGLSLSLSFTLSQPCIHCKPVHHSFLLWCCMTDEKMQNYCLSLKDRAVMINRSSSMERSESASMISNPVK